MPGYRKLDGQPLEELMPPANVSNPAFATIEDINDLAEVAGMYWYGTGLNMPVLWRADGTPVDLNQSLGGTGWANLHSPQALNNAGVIVGFGLKQEGKGKNRRYVDGAYMLIPE